MLVKSVDLYPPYAQRRDIYAAIDKVVQSGQYIGGPDLERFEDQWADYCGTVYAVGVSSGFAALQLILKAHYYEPAPPLSTVARYSSLTCFPTPLAIQAAGFEAIPVSPHHGNMLLDQSKLHTGMNVPVFLYGAFNPNLCQEPDRHIVHDACQAHGRLYAKHSMGAKSTAAAWSFYPTKNLGAIGDAGAVTTNDFGLVEEIKALRSYGTDGAINARLDPLQAAILSAKLPYLDFDNEKREDHAEIYLRELKDTPLILPDTAVCNNWHQFVIRCHYRTVFREYLQSHGIQTQIHYEQPAMWGNPGPWEQEWSNTVLSLPVGPHLSETDIYYVCSVVKEWFE